ncbi:HAMP domain-containing protein [Actinomadura sp. CNU-125]|uniref:HAMP domain-containing protein n=1 Tax=Actinomadura sp. CNU-125 TaxID=1904961 RepID=UPI0039678AF0
MLEIRVRWVLLVVVVVANVVGGLVVLLFATFVVPDPPLDDPRYVHLVNAVAFFSYPVLAGPGALGVGLWLWRPVVRLVRDGGPPDREQRRAVLLGPLRLTLLVGGLWGVGAAGWAILDLVLFTGRLAVKTGLTCLLGAATTCTIVYLLSERLLRPAAALVLAAEPPRRFRLPGVTTRVMLAWALGTAIPVFGLICVAIAALAAPDIDVTKLAITILGLGGVALFAGMYVTYMATRAIADPIKSVRTGMAYVERGDLQAVVPVYDASEVGQLQAGFNHMVAGLREHERLRDLFGRHVGEEVADLALEHGDITLGGEVRDVGGAVRGPRGVDAAGGDAGTGRGRGAAQPVLRGGGGGGGGARRVDQQVRGRGTPRSRSSGRRASWRTRRAGRSARPGSSRCGCARTCPSWTRGSACRRGRSWRGTSAPSSGSSTR